MRVDGGDHLSLEGCSIQDSRPRMVKKLSPRLRDFSYWLPLVRQESSRNLGPNTIGNNTEQEHWIVKQHYYRKKTCMGSKIR